MNIYVYLLGLEDFCKNEDEVNQYKVRGNGMNFFRTEVFLLEKHNNYFPPPIAADRVLC